MNDTHPFRDKAEAEAIAEQLRAKGYQVRLDVDGTCRSDDNGHFHAQGIIVFATPKLLKKLGVQ